MRRVLAAAVLLVALVATVPAPAGAQSGPLSVPAQTKEEAQAARAPSSLDEGSGISLQTGLLIGAVLVLGGAAVFILRDASGSVGAGSRAAPDRPVGPDAVGRGAPKTMFGGEAAPGGRTGKNKKREKTRRQKQARRRNR